MGHFNPYQTYQIKLIYSTYYLDLENLYSYLEFYVTKIYNVTRIYLINDVNGQNHDNVDNRQPYFAIKKVSCKIYMSCSF